ncbi:MAG: branched-chain amino acid ABC transporter permease/ATP-binding protein [Acidimicrobiia bacterium]|nr:branched-chain amino acid ABC transporter permease/ATP-binding protein [Acidimicrobiia bacterium]
MRSFLQFLIIGLGAGATYTLFAHGAVLIYRGSGIVNFAQGAIGTVAAYIAFVDLQGDRDWATLPAIVVAVAAAAAVSLAFQILILRALKQAAAIVRVIATIGLVGLLLPVVEKRYGSANQPVDSYFPNDVFDWGGIRVQEQRIYMLAITLIVTYGLWAWTRYTRVGLAINASAENERAVQTLGWSPDRLAALTWAVGGALAGVAAVLSAPLTGLSAITFTIVVTVAGLGAALFGGFYSFPMTLVGGLIIGVGEALATRYIGDVTDLLGQELITGLNRASAFLVIFIVVVVRGRGLPLRSHVAERLPKLGTGQISIKGVILAAAVLVALLFGVMDESWAQATYTSLASAVMILSIVVLTGYAGQISLAQWAFAGIGALIAGQLVRADVPVELAMVLGILLTIPVGLVFALPALRTRGVNLAVVTLGLGFLVSEVVFANPHYLGDSLDGGTRIGSVELFGLEVDALNHPHAWALVNLICFVALALLVANLRRSRTGRRLIAVRTNERAAASLGISVFGVKLYAFAVSSGLAAAAGILVGFRSQVIQYQEFNVFASINSLGAAVVGGLGFVLGAAFGALTAVGGIGTRVIEEWLGLENQWDLIIGSLVLFLILITQPDGIADLATRHRRVWQRLRLAAPAPEREPLAPPRVEAVKGATLSITDLTVRFGSVVAVDGVSMEVRPGEVVGLIGPNGAGKTTVIDAVSGFVAADSGSISFDGRPINAMNATQRARLGLRRSFQSLELFEDLSVVENIRAGADLDATRLSWLTDLFWPGRADLPSTAVAAVHEFGLEPHLGDLPDRLPHGRRRQVGIARTVASGPAVVMLDEPAAGLDQNESAELARLIRRLADERGMGVLLVEHDVSVVMSTCDRIVVVDFGAVIASGPPAEIRDSRAVRDAYLGDAEAAEEMTS